MTRHGKSRKRTVGKSEAHWTNSKRKRLSFDRPNVVPVPLAPGYIPSPVEPRPGTGGAS